MRVQGSGFKGSGFRLRVQQYSPDPDHRAHLIQVGSEADPTLRDVEVI